MKNSYKKTKLAIFSIFILLNLIATTVFADYDYVITTNYFNNVPGIDGIILKSKFFGYQSAINRDWVDPAHGPNDRAYDYGPFIVQDLKKGIYRMYSGGRWKDTSKSADGDHVLQFTSQTGKGDTWTMPNNKPEMWTGSEDGYNDVWFSGNYLEPEVLKINSTSYYMYTQVMILSNENIDIPAVPALTQADRFQLLTSTDGTNWSRWSTNRSVFVNVDAPRYSYFHHEEALYVPWDSNTPYWIYFFLNDTNGANQSFRIRSDDPTTFDYQDREACSGIAQLGNQIGYTENGPGDPLFIRITFANDATSRSVPSLQFSHNGTRFYQGLKDYSLLDGSKNNADNKNCYFLGFSTYDGLGKFEYLGNNTYRTIYAATTANSPLSPQIFWSEVGVGELVFQLIPKIYSSNVVVNGDFELPSVPAATLSNPANWANTAGGNCLYNPHPSIAAISPLNGQIAYFNDVNWQLRQTFPDIILQPNTLYTVTFDSYAQSGANLTINAGIYQGNGTGETSNILHTLDSNDVEKFDAGEGFWFGAGWAGGCWHHVPPRTTPADDPSFSRSFSFVTPPTLTSPRPTENLGVIFWGAGQQVWLDNVKVEIRPLADIVPPDNSAEGNFSTNYTFDFPVLGAGGTSSAISNWYHGPGTEIGLHNPASGLPAPLQGQVIYLNSPGNDSLMQTFDGEKLKGMSLYTVSFDAFASIGAPKTINVELYQGSGSGTTSSNDYKLHQKDVKFFNANDGTWLDASGTYAGAQFTVMTNTVDAYPGIYSHSFSFYTPEILTEPRADKSIGIRFWGASTQIEIDNVIVKRQPVPEPFLIVNFYLLFIIYYYRRKFKY